MKIIFLNFQYIVEEFKKFKWTVELDTFEDVAPIKGKLSFSNVIVTRNPNSVRHLVLACHYDSKLFNFEFIGATDSAVPCAMLIYMAKLLNDVLPKIESVRIGIGGGGGFTIA